MSFEDLISKEEKGYQEFERIISECNSSEGLLFGEESWKRKRKPSRFYDED